MHLSDEQFASLILNLLKDKPPEPATKRQFSRLPLCSRTIITLLGADDRPLAVAKVIVQDISAGGISFLHRSRIEKGTKFWIPLMHNNHEIPVLTRAVHCRQQSESVYRIGAQFIGLTSSEEVSKKNMAG
jgi:hypothetical protein